MHNKSVLEEFIYKLEKATSGFSLNPSVSVIGFSSNQSLPLPFLKRLKDSGINIGSIICVLCDSKTNVVDIVFSDTSLYLDVTKPNSSQADYFPMRYDEIKELRYIPRESCLVIVTQDNRIDLKTPLWSTLNIYDYLQFATGKYAFSGKNKASIDSLQIDIIDGHSVGALASGLVYSNVSNASTLYFDDKLATPRGHGFAAERANHLIDTLQGKDAKIIGDDNALNGADRIVDGISVQSKYCASGSKCVEECFKNGEFRYWNADGSPMRIEVPSDKYDAAVKAMEERIRKGQVEGITDPAEAKNIVRKGNITYQQAKNIAKAGTVESITFDAASGAIIATYSFGITAAISFASAIWNGEDMDIAVQSAAAQGLKVGGTAFLTAVLAGQLSKAGLNSALVGSSNAIVSAIGPKASAVLVNAFRSGTNIYGAAAMKSAAKLLRGNVITGIASIAILSVGDVVNIFRGRISGGQLFKNLASTASTVAGGSAGWVSGAAAGATIGSVIPIIGTGIGGLIGGLAGAFAGGSLASKAAGAVLNEFIEDDADFMVEIIQEVFAELAEEYLTSQKEAEIIADNLKSKLTGGVLKDMFESSDREEFARDLLEPLFEREAAQREHICLPTRSEMQSGLRAVLECVADEMDGGSVVLPT